MELLRRTPVLLRAWENKFPSMLISQPLSAFSLLAATAAATAAGSVFKKEEYPSVSLPSISLTAPFIFSLIWSVSWSNLDGAAVPWHLIQGSLGRQMGAHAQEWPRVPFVAPRLFLTAFVLVGPWSSLWISCSGSEEKTQGKKKVFTDNRWEIYRDRVATKGWKVEMMRAGDRVPTV